MIWGASFLFQRVAVPELGPNIVAFARLALGAVFLVLVALAMRKPLLLRERGKDFLRIGLFNSALPFWCFAYASITLPAGVLAVLNAMVPLFAVLLGWWQGQVPSREKLAGVLLGIAGVAMIVGFGGIPLTWMSMAGFLAGLAAAAMYAYASVEIRRTFTDTDPLVIATGSLIAASLILLPTIFIQPPATLDHPMAWWMVLPLGVVCSGLAYLLYFRLLRDVGVARAVMVTLLVPVFALLWGVLFLDEHPKLLSLAGTATVLFSMALILEKVRLPGFLQRTA